MPLGLGGHRAMGPHFEAPPTDAWIISDAADYSGNVVADCGPVGAGLEGRGVP